MRQGNLCLLRRATQWLVHRGNQWLWHLLLSGLYWEPPPYRREVILIMFQSITQGMTPIINGAGIGVAHGAGDGLSEFPSHLADAGSAGSGAAFPIQAFDASALVIPDCFIRGSGASALPMRVLVAVSAAAVADSMINVAGPTGEGSRLKEIIEQPDVSTTSARI